jgi:hypothetical protein
MNGAIGEYAQLPVLYYYYSNVPDAAQRLLDACLRPVTLGSTTIAPPFTLRRFEVCWWQAMRLDRTVPGQYETWRDQGEAICKGR